MRTRARRRGMMMGEAAGDYAGVVAADSILYYRLGDSGSSVMAEEISGDDGTFYNPWLTPANPVSIPGLVAGDADTAVDFVDATEQKVGAAPAGIAALDDALTAITVECLIKRSSDPGANRPFVTYWERAGAYTRFILWRSAFGAGLAFQVNDQTGSTSFESPRFTGTVYDGNPHTVTGRWSASDGFVRIFFDGLEVGSGTATPGMTAMRSVTGRLTIGLYSNMQPQDRNSWNGPIDDVSIADVALSDARIFQRAQLAGVA